MKTYPSIKTKLNGKVPIVAFDKLDGSNIRAEWNRKEGWYKFGSRYKLLEENQGTIFKAKQLIIDKYSEGLVKVFNDKGYDSVTCFFEFFGENSKFGTHVDDDTHDVVLIDVNPYKKGIIGPFQFIDDYEHLGIPKIIWKGLADEEFYFDVKKGRLPEITDEGVVCKGVRSNQTIMFKIKTEGWLERLMEHCGHDQSMFNRLK